MNYFMIFQTFVSLNNLFKQLEDFIFRNALIVFYKVLEIGRTVFHYNIGKIFVSHDIVVFD